MITVWGWVAVVIGGMLAPFIVLGAVGVVLDAVDARWKRRAWAVGLTSEASRADVQAKERRDAERQRRVEVREAAFAARRKAMASRMEARRVAVDSWQHQFNGLLYGRRAEPVLVEASPSPVVDSQQARAWCGLCRNHPGEFYAVADQHGDHLHHIRKEYR